MTNSEDQAQAAVTAGHAPSLPSAMDLRCGDQPASAEQLAPLRQALARWAEEIGLSAEITDSIILAANEAITNVISHAYATGTGTLDLYGRYERGMGRVQLTVRDHGRWRPPSPVPDLLHGRGLPLIHALAGEVVIDRAPTGTTVRMTWSVSAA